MITSCQKILRQSPKNGPRVVSDRARLSMHQFRRANYPPSKRLANRLMPQTNAQYRNLPRKSRNQRNRNPRLPRRPRPRRNHNPLRPQIRNLIQRNHVIPAHQKRLSHLPEILRQVVGKRIVVIQQQNHFTGPRAAPLALPPTPPPKPAPCSPSLHIPSPAPNRPPLRRPPEYARSRLSQQVSSKRCTNPNSPKNPNTKSRRHKSRAALAR